MKILRTVILILTVVFAAMLWVTRSEWLPSQSAFALSDNVMWYYFMHTTIALSLGFDADRGRWFSVLGVLSVLGIVVFDMYSYPMLHNISTALMAVFATISIIYYASKRERPYAIVNCGVGALIFILGFLVWDVHLFFAEVIIEFTIGVAMARRIWIDE